MLQHSNHLCSDNHSVAAINGGTFSIFGGLSGRSAVVSVEELAVLKACEVSASFEVHAERLARQFGVPSDTVRALLSQLIERQLLTDPYAPLLPARTDAIRTKHSVDLVGIPTVGTPRAPLRTVASLVANAQPYGRTVRVLLSYDRDNTCDAVEAPVACAMNVATRPERRRFARRLADDAGCDPRIAEFGLCGPNGARSTTGANRNFLLLAGAGGIVLQIDDDVVVTCRQWQHAREELRVQSEGHAREMANAATRPDALEFVRETPVDLIGEHESYIGRETTECLAWASVTKQLCLGPVSAAWTGLLRHRSFVRAVQAGVVGDLGVDLPTANLDVSSLRQREAIADPARYAMVRLSREGVRLAPAPTLAPMTVVQPMAMSFDMHGHLAPFPPLSLNEDFAWAAAMTTAEPGASQIHLPFAIEHNPPQRPAFPEHAFGDAWDLRCTNTWLAALVLSGRSAVSRTAKPLVMLGRYLIGLTELTTDEFWQVLRESLHTVCTEQLARAQGLLGGSGGEPSWWAHDVRARSRAVEAMLGHDFGDGPIDLGQWSQAPLESSRDAFKSLVSDYGHLMEAWPALHAAAAREPY